MGALQGNQGGEGMPCICSRAGGARPKWGLGELNAKKQTKHNLLFAGFVVFVIEPGFAD